MKNIKYLLLFVLAMCFQLLMAQESETSTPTENNKENAKTIEQDNKEIKKRKWIVNFDVTFTSRFLWRGLLLGDYPSIQPSFTLSNGSLFTGVWASYSLAPSESGGSASSEVPVSDNYKEIAPYIGYSSKVGKNSNMTLMVLTHYNPNIGGFFNFNNKPKGTNTALTNRVELRAGYNIGKLDFFGGWDFINDPSNNTSLYLEMGYTFDMPKNIKVRPFISAVPNENYYTTNGKADVTQIGWYTSKAFSIGKDINLVLKIDMVYNPDRDQFNSAFNASIKL